MSSSVPLHLPTCWWVVVLLSTQSVSRSKVFPPVSIACSFVQKIFLSLLYYPTVFLCCQISTTVSVGDNYNTFNVEWFQGWLYTYLMQISGSYLVVVELFGFLYCSIDTLDTMMFWMYCKSSPTPPITVNQLRISICNAANHGLPVHWSDRVLCMHDLWKGMSCLPTFWTHYL